MLTLNFSYIMMFIDSIAIKIKKEGEYRDVKIGYSEI